MDRCTFSVGHFDSDGVEVDSAIFIHFGDFRMRVGPYKQLIKLRDNINRLIKEIEEDYSEYTEK